MRMYDKYFNDAFFNELKIKQLLVVTYTFPDKFYGN